MEMEQEKRRVLGLACRLKRKRSNLSSGISQKRCRISGGAEESGSSSSIITNVDEEASCSSRMADVGGRLGLAELQRDSRDYADVADLFLRGLGVLQCDASIQRIDEIMDGHKMQLEFEKQQAKMAASNGDANVHWAWYGAGKDEIYSIVEHGFRMAVPSSVGYCFAPIECSRISAVQAQVDAAGEQHLLLCQVAFGKVGVIGLDNGLDDLSEKSLDTGVYDLANPKCFVLPAANYEASRIVPHHVVRFKLSDQWREIIEASAISGKSSARPMPCIQVHATSRMNLSPVQLKQKKVSAQPPILDENQALTRCRVMSFPTLLSILQSKVPNVELSQLQQSYSSFKSGRMSKIEFIHEVRQIVGDGLLYKCICFIKLLSQGREEA